MLMKLSKGAIGQAVSIGKPSFARRPIEVHGAKGTLIIENSFAYLTGTGEDSTISLELINGDGKNVRHFAATECFRLEIEQFSRAIKGQGEMMTTALEGLHAVTIIETFYQAIRSGRMAEV